MNTIIIVLLSILTIVPLVHGHGMMIHPVNRASRWRDGFKGPTEYTDNQLSCGGAGPQWEQHGGKCGVCGDEYGVTPRFAYPGLFAQDPPIVRNYDEGQVIEIKIRLTANHKGYFTFRVAPLVNPPIKQEDLDKNVLKRPNANGDTEWPVTTEDGTGDFNMLYTLPVGLTCKHCVLQWWYTTGNNYGGHNPETFVNCADIEIVSGNGLPSPMTSQPSPQTIPPLTTSTCPPCNCSPQPVVCPKPKPCPNFLTTIRPTPKVTKSKCEAVSGSGATDQWCINNCAMGYCPPSHCRNCN